MRRLLLGVTLFGWMGLVAGSLAQAQSKIYYRDAAKKKDSAEVSGTIQSEDVNKIVLKPNIGANKEIPSVDVIDVAYEVKPDVRADYRKAETADRVTAPKHPAGTPARNSALKDALADYQKVLPRVAGVKFVERHIQYKIADLTAQLAGDDKAQMGQAIELLAKYQKENSDSWQVINCIRTLAQLYVDTNSFDKAVAAYDALAKVPGISDEVKGECNSKAAMLLIKAKRHGEAADRLKTILAKLPKTNPQYSQYEMLLWVCTANSPAKFKEAVVELDKLITSSKDNNRTALLYNTLGDCYLNNNQPRDAMWQYLWVDQVYNQDRTEHLKAVTQLTQIFKESKEPKDRERSKEYADKLEKLKK